jgi:CubicO group peptidase (beta-lactamase class C family)
MAGESLTSFNEKILLSTPCASYLLAKNGEILNEFIGGYSLIQPKKIYANKDTIFDIASLTKPLATALIALKSYSEGNFDINQPVEQAKPSFTPLDLLRHEAGFPPWYPLYKFKDKDEAEDFLLRKIVRMNPKETSIYSCLGYILLGFILEKKLGKSLEELFVELIREPLGIKKDDATFNPDISRIERIAGTELNGEFEKEMAEKEGAIPPLIPQNGLWGVVHDGNARFLKGVAGNAGLFATLKGTYQLLKCFLKSSSFLDKKVLELCYKRGEAKNGEERSAAFKLSSSPDWSLGRELKMGSLAHEGFTGTFVSINEEGEIMILLTNRIHPVHPRKPFSEERIQFVRACYEFFKKS